MRIYHLNTTLSYLPYYEFKLSLSIITAFHDCTACLNRAAPLTTYYEQNQLPQHVRLHCDCNGVHPLALFKSSNVWRITNCSFHTLCYRSLLINFNRPCFCFGHTKRSCYVVFVSNNDDIRVELYKDILAIATTSDI